MEEVLQYLKIPKVIRTSEARDFILNNKDNLAQEETLMVNKMQQFVRKQILKGK